MGLEGLQHMLDQVKALEAQIVALEARRAELKAIVEDAELMATLPERRHELAVRERAVQQKEQQTDAALTRATAKEAGVDAVLARKTAEGNETKAALIAEGEQQKAADIAEGRKQQAALVADGRETREGMIRHARQEAKAAHKEEVARWQAVEPKIAGFLKALDEAATVGR